MPGAINRRDHWSDCGGNIVWTWQFWSHPVKWPWTTCVYLGPWGKKVMSMVRTHSSQNQGFRVFTYFVGWLWMICKIWYIGLLVNLILETWSLELIRVWIVVRGKKICVLKFLLLSQWLLGVVYELEKSRFKKKKKKMVNTLLFFKSIWKWYRWIDWVKLNYLDYILVLRYLVWWIQMEVLHPKINE